MLNTREWDQVRQLLDKARIEGLDPISVLDDAGWLFGEDRFTKTQRLVQQRILHSLDRLSLNEILALTGKNVEDVTRVDLIEAMRTWFHNGMGVSN